MFVMEIPFADEKATAVMNKIAIKTAAHTGKLLGRGPAAAGTPCMCAVG